MKTLNMIAGTLVLSTLFFSCDKNAYAPEMTNQEFIIEENSPAGTLIGIIDATDGDEDQLLSFEIIEGHEEGYFQINHRTGALSVGNPSGFNYEANRLLTIQVEVEDDHKNSLSATAYITVNITDVFEHPEGQIAYYPFDGNADDVSGNGHNGIIHGAELSSDRFGTAQSAYYFDGDLDYIDLGNSHELKRYKSDYTVAGWIKLDAFPPTYNFTIMSNRSHTTPLVSGSLIGVGGLQSSLSKRIQFVQNAVVTDDEFTYDFMSSNTQLELDTWYFFCVTYEYHGDLLNKIRIYINGNLESQKLMGEIIDPEDESTFLGCEPKLAPVEYSFNGTMDDIEMYNRALSEVEIMSLYNR